MRYTLEEVANEFELWRQSRGNKKEPIPSHLWRKAKSLLPHYKNTPIRQALKISGKKFNEQFLNDKKGHEAPQGEGFASGFIDIAANQDHGKCELTLQGLRKSLQLKVNIKQLPEILPLLEGYL